MFVRINMRDNKFRRVLLSPILPTTDRGTDAPDPSLILDGWWSR